MPLFKKYLLNKKRNQKKKKKRSHKNNSIKHNQQPSLHSSRKNETIVIPHHIHNLGYSLPKDNVEVDPLLLPHLQCDL